MGAKKVLLPVDGSPFSQSILEYVEQFIKPEEAELIVLHVAPWPKGINERLQPIYPLNWLMPVAFGQENVRPYTETSLQAIYASQQVERMENQIINDLQKQTQPLRSAGYRITCVGEFGDPAEAIIGFVERNAIDLITMATHGRSGLSHLVLGSVAEHVLRRVAVPVLLIRPIPQAAHTETQAHDQGEHTLTS